MKQEQGYLRVSASDLSNHLACHHLTALDLAVANGVKAASEWRDPDALVLQQRGFEHERAYLDYLGSLGLSIVVLREVGEPTQANEKMLSAMASGADVIAQPIMVDGRWFGRADILRRVEKEGPWMKWSYEVYDCKLARETKAATILQLSLYSELLEILQGVPPEFMYVVPPSDTFAPEPYRVLDFAAYYRQVKMRLESAVEPPYGSGITYPEPNEHCSVCRWWWECDARWRQDDHLSLVADITKLQRKQLQVWETTTVELLAKLPLPLSQRPENGSKESYVRTREQARVQVAARHQAQPVFELLEIQSERGLNLLPEPSPGDIFFDLEGDPFVDYSGLEYLFGFVSCNESGLLVYQGRWSYSQAEEKRAFEWFIDFVTQQWEKHPSLHVYHFHSYEPSALKRLMGRHASREDQVDRMLRAHLLVDLHTVVRQGLRAGVEQYSLKKLEAFYRYVRQVPLEVARHAKRILEHSLELTRSMEIKDGSRDTVEGYNRDDCCSTLALRDWLEELRAGLIRGGHDLPRPVAQDGAPSEAVGERQQRTAALHNMLLCDIPAEPEKQTPEQKGCSLLANLLDWHRRETRAVWREYFTLKRLSDEDLLDEKSALSGLQWMERIEQSGKTVVDRYRFEIQETEIRERAALHNREMNIGTVRAIDLAVRSVDIKKTQNAINEHPSSVFEFPRVVDADEMSNSLFRLGSWVEANGIDSPGPYRAARDLLLRLPPRIAGQKGQSLVRDGETNLDAAKRLVLSLDSGTLAVQGPPGAGKTYSGARMIVELVNQKKKVGITALGHKIIRELLDKVAEAARELNLTEPKCVQKLTTKSKLAPPYIQEVTDNAVALRALLGGQAQILAGTAWLWAREEFFEAVDVLFVEEAGQMSLANVLAIGQAAKNIVLLGDPQQLEQPQKASHPDGAEFSALQHLLVGTEAKTLSSDNGLFLGETQRLHPSICQFTSEVFYESRLRSIAGLEHQRIEGNSELGASGLCFVPVIHAGNRNSSLEEVDRIAELVKSLVLPGVIWVDAKENSKHLTIDDILIITPYNAQVLALSGRIPHARVGTVDKFQGMEAPVVIYSLASSSAEDAPRGMEFLYSLNRLNVATSRARGLCILVASPKLFEPECSNPRQMKLANAFCRFLELSRVLEATNESLLVGT